MRLYVVPTNKVERALKKLEDSGYDAGPEPSDEFSIREGDRLQVAFRGNVKCVDFRPRLKTVFTTNLDTTVNMHIEQHDVFVQKSYKDYRGFVHLQKIIKVPLAPTAADKKPAAGGAPPAAAPPQQQPAAGAEAPQPVQGGEAADSPGVGADAAPAETAPVEEPPPPMFEMKYIMLSELLITFPKVGFTVDRVSIVTIFNLLSVMWCSLDNISRIFH